MARGEQVNPDVLIWARESAGLDVGDAAKRLGLVAPNAVAGQQKLIELERGSRLPSRTQLSKIAKTYRRPLLTFYMAVPPPKGERGRDFRSTGSEISSRDNALLDSLLRDVKARQEMIKSLLEDDDDTTEKAFVSSCSVDDGAPRIAERIGSALRLPPESEGRPRGANEFFAELRNKVEALGVFVLLVGDLGSHHSALSEEVFRGFAIADKIAPFIVINDHDARTARSFTLIHELTHLYLGQTGVSGAPESARVNAQFSEIEDFCNDVAGLVLLPNSFVTQRPAGLDNQVTASRFIEETAKAWSVSEPLVAFRLRRLGWISAVQYRDINALFARRWQSFKATTKAANQLKEGGPDYYVVKQHRLGIALVDVVRRTLRENRLTHTKAAKVLGVKPSSVEPLIRKFERNVSSMRTEGAR